MVEVKFLAAFKDITGESKIDLEYKGTVSGLISLINEKYGDEFKKTLFNEEGNLKDYIKIMVNHEDINTDEKLNNSVKDEDKVVIFQTIAGG
ncbi:MAG: hypothetical protein Kow0019_16640 [Methanobacteriaceae archaeon]